MSVKGYWNMGTRIRLYNAYGHFLCCRSRVSRPMTDHMARKAESTHSLALSMKLANLLKSTKLRYQSIGIRTITRWQ